MSQASERTTGRVAALGVIGALALSAGAAPAAAGCRELAPLLRRQPTTGEWQQIESLEVVHWLFEVEGSPVKEGVALGLVEAPPGRVFKVVTDNGRFADFMPYVEASSLETLADGSLVNFQRLDLPWPVSDREYKIALANSVDAAGEPSVWTAAWTHVKGFGNIAESHGAWRVFACGEASLLEYRVVTDPGGNIPTFLKNTATRRSLKRLIDAVRGRVGHPSYDGTE